MAINVCLALVRDTPSKIVVGTYPPATGMHSLLGGSDKPDLECHMFEGWEFDFDAGVVRFAPAPTSAWPNREILIESVTRLTWCGVEATSFSGEYYHYALTLRFDDEGHGRLISLPGSDEYLCASQAQVRQIASQLHALLKPVCPQLETTGLEDMMNVFTNPAEAFKSLQGKMGTLLADLNDAVPSPQPADPSAPALSPATDPHAPLRELLEKTQEALGRLSDVAAARQRKPALTGAGLALRLVLVLAAALLFGLWFFNR
jgi:hypothetical protein